MKQTQPLKKIDIEKLLQWAFHDELPKGHPVSTSPWDSISRIGELGVRVQTSGFGGDGLGFVHGEPHADAQAVAVAVKALPEAFRFTETDCAGMLGCYAACDPLAIRAVAGAPFKLAALVIRCAVLGERMVWNLGTPQLRPVYYRSDRGGRPAPMILGIGDDGELTAVHPDHKGRWSLDRQPRAHLTFEEPSIAELLEARAEYVAWRTGLALLAVALAGHLAEHEVTPPAALPDPWRTGESPAGRVFTVPASGSLAKRPLGHPRKVAEPLLESVIEKVTRERRTRLARDRRKATMAKSHTELELIKL